MEEPKQECLSLRTTYPQFKQIRRDRRRFSREKMQREANGAAVMRPIVIAITSAEAENPIFPRDRRGNGRSGQDHKVSCRPAADEARNEKPRRGCIDGAAASEHQEKGLAPTRCRLVFRFQFSKFNGFPAPNRFKWQPDSKPALGIILVTQARG